MTDPVMWVGCLYVLREVRIKEAKWGVGNASRAA